MWPTVLEAKTAFTGIDYVKFDDILAFVAGQGDWQLTDTLPANTVIKLMTMDWFYRLGLLTVESRYTAISKLSPHLDGIARCIPNSVDELKTAKLIALSIVDGHRLQIPRYANVPPGDSPVVVYDLKMQQWIDKYGARPCTIITCDLVAMLHRLLTYTHNYRNKPEVSHG